MNWIPIKERLPTVEEKAAAEKFIIRIEKRDENKIEVTLSSFLEHRQQFHFDMHNINWHVTHWMNIPSTDL